MENVTLAVAKSYAEELLMGQGVQISDNETVENKTWSSSKIASNIPTTLPANGGNSDTVNGHTVETDVPENAVFTDTIYDDTEVKGSIDKLNSNLDALEFGEVAGGKNLIPYPYSNKSGNYNGVEITINDDYSISVNGTNTGKRFDFGFAGISRIADIPYMVSLKAGKSYTLSLEFFSGSLPDNSDVIINGWNDNSVVMLLAVCDSSVTSFTFTVPADSGIKHGCVYLQNKSGTVFDNVRLRPMLTEGNEVVPYEPYIPSVKMIAEENAQQNTEAMDLKMLGWTVPKECPVQNYVDAKGVFHQRVGRVDLGSLTWERYDTNTSGKYRMGSSGISTLVKRPSSNATKFNGYSSKYSVITSDNAYACIAGIGVASTTGNVYVYDENYTARDDTSTFKSAMSGVYLYYELATEIKKSVDGNEVVTKVNESLSIQLGNDINNVSWVENTAMSENGTVNANQYGFHCSDFIQVTKTNYTYYYYSTVDTGYNTRILGYDKNGNFKSQLVVYANRNIGFVSFTINIPNDVYFIKISEHSSFHDRKLVPEENLSTQVTQINNNLSVIGKCKNMFNAKLPATTQNGVTCTNNGDGTYTVNGTATNDNVWFMSSQITGLKNGVTYKIIGDPSGVVHNSVYSYIYDSTAKKSTNPILGQHTFVYDSSHKYDFRIMVSKDQTASNMIFKPMLTTNLDATYDDFVPYTGDGDTLAADVAELKNDLGGIDISSGVTALATFKIDSIDLKLRGNHVSGNIVVSLQSGGVFRDSYVLQIPKEYAPKFKTPITANGYLNSSTKYLPGYGIIGTDGKVLFYSNNETSINIAYISFSYDI